MVLAREQNIPQGAFLLAQHFEVKIKINQSKNQFDLAIEFYCRANKIETAFKLAQQNNNMDLLFNYLKTTEGKIHRNSNSKFRFL